MFLFAGWFPWRWKPSAAVKQHKAQEEGSTSLWDQYLTDPSPTTDPENRTEAMGSDVPATSDPAERGTSGIALLWR